jgi:hypothetical protein
VECASCGLGRARARARVSLSLSQFQSAGGSEVLLLQVMYLAELGSEMQVANSENCNFVVAILSSAFCLSAW